MAIELRVPSLGESVTQAMVGAWLKKEGDAVALDEPLVEVESEKATLAVPSPSAGILRRILRQQGDTVAVGEVLAELEEGAQAAAGAAASPAAPVALGAGAQAVTATAGARPAARASAQAAPATAAPAPATPPAAAARPAAAVSGSAPPAASGEGAAEPAQLRAPPSVRRRMAEEGLSATALPAGTVVRRDDVERALHQPPQLPAAQARSWPEPGPRERLVPMTPLRRTVARRLLEAQASAAILTTFNEADMTNVLALRARHGEAFLKKHGVKLGFMSFFVKAAVEALRAWPSVNGEVRGDAVLYRDHYDIGVAVGGGKGLVVPVLRDADALGFAEVERRIAALAVKARENRILPDDLAGGTFTISNGGVYGSLLSTPILNPPQSGILGLHKIQKRPVAGPGDTVVVRPMMYLALSYDHRLIDGREAVSFLVRVKECIEEPERLLLEA